MKYEDRSSVELQSWGLGLQSRYVHWGRGCNMADKPDSECGSYAAQELTVEECAGIASTRNATAVVSATCNTTRPLPQRRVLSLAVYIFCCTNT